MAKLRYFLSSKVAPGLKLPDIPEEVPSDGFIEIGEEMFRSYNIQKLISNRVLTFKTEKVTERKKAVTKEKE